MKTTLLTAMILTLAAQAQANTEVTQKVQHYVLSERALEHQCFESNGKYKCATAATAIQSTRSLSVDLGKAEVDLEMGHCIPASVSFRYQAKEDVEFLWESALIAVNGRPTHALPSERLSGMLGFEKSAQKLSAGTRFESTIVDVAEAKSSALAGEKSCWPLRNQVIDFSVNVRDAAGEIRPIQATWTLDVRGLSKAETVAYLPKPQAMKVAPNMDGVELNPTPPGRNWKGVAAAGALTGGLFAGAFGGLGAIYTVESGEFRDLKHLAGLAAAVGFVGAVTAAAGTVIIGPTWGAPEDEKVAAYNAQLRKRDYQERFVRSQEEVALWETQIGDQHVDATQIVEVKTTVKRRVASQSKKLLWPVDAKPSQSKRLAGCKE